MNVNKEQAEKECATFWPVWARAYSHVVNNQYETHEQVIKNRVIPHLRNLMEQKEQPMQETDIGFIQELMLKKVVHPAGRFYWTANRPWAYKPENFSGMYNCTSMTIESIDDIVYMAELAMQGCGTGAVLLKEFVDKIPKLQQTVYVKVTKEPSNDKKGREDTRWETYEHELFINVGDSRQGWVEAQRILLDVCINPYDYFDEEDIEEALIDVYIDLSNVRKAGIPLSGFGGMSNPGKLGEAFVQMGEILQKVYWTESQKLTPLDVCLIIDWMAYAIVAGGIRRSAGMRQFDWDTPDFKAGLYTWHPDGSWTVDPLKKAMTMANHTKVYWALPTAKEVLESVSSQFESGEGAFMFAPNAISRVGNANGFGLNPCGEIIGEWFHCNLSEVHLNLIDPADEQAQVDAFYAATLTALPFLSHTFIHPKMQESRLKDPIVGVSFTGLFDFLVKSKDFGRDWVLWMMDGCPDNHPSAVYWEQEEARLLSKWKSVVNKATDYFFRQYSPNKEFGKRPTRTTTVQPAGTKSLLTNATPGWHTPMGTTFIRRITVNKNHPVAMAAYEYGIKCVPAQSSVDSEGKYIDNIFDDRVHEWLLEVPVKVDWYDIAGDIAVEDIPAVSQLRLYMQVQNYYTEHNTSGTIRVSEDEIEDVAFFIYKTLLYGEPYISVTLLKRVKSQYPNLPFENISIEDYEEKVRQIKDVSFLELLNKNLSPVPDNQVSFEEGPGGCDSDKCLL